MWHVYSILWFLLFTVACDDVNITGLMNDLFKNYHNDVRPMCSDGDPVTVKVGLALRQVIDLVSICGDHIHTYEPVHSAVVDTDKNLEL